MRFARLLGLSGLTCLLLHARAGYVPEPGPVQGDLQKAQVVLVGTIESFIPDPQGVPRPQVVMNGAGLVEMLAFQAPGTYHIKTLQTVKGDGPGELDIHLPLLSSFYFGQTQFPAREKARVMLPLVQDENKKWVPAEPMRPLMPVSGEAKLAAKADAIDVLLVSMKDATIRPTVANLLRTVKDPRVAEAIPEYTNDSNLDVVSDVVYCRAVNQDVKAIPIIGKVAEQCEKSGKGSGPVGGLTLYTTPEAAEYLALLAAEGTYYTRLNALSALTKVANEKSIPYLIKAMGVPDPKPNPNPAGFLATMAYGTIGKVLGKSAQSREYYLTHSQDDLETIKAWWETQHPVAATAPSSATQK